MYRSKIYPRKGTRSALGLMLLSLTVLLMVSVTGVAQAQGVKTVTGVVYRDYDVSGTRDTTIPGTEPGVGGIIVNAYGAANTIVGTATSSQVPATLGEYTLTWTTADVRVRLEFTGLPAYLKSGVFGAASDTSVQFVGDGAVADFAVNNPNQFCGQNPKISTSCYVFGDQVTGANNNLAAIISFDYSSVNTPANEITLATAQQVGATYGLAPQPRTNSLFAAAFVKRHVGLVSTNNVGGNPGMIYKIDASGGGVVPYITLAAGADPHTPAADVPPYFNDAGAFNAVGRIGIADIDLSEDENQLFAVNLATKQLQIIDATGATGSLISSHAIPAAQGCSAADSIPGALNIHDGIVYVGVTCTGPAIANLSASVYPFSGGAFGAAVATIDLNYPRGYASTDGSCPAVSSVVPAVTVAGNCVAATWQPWVTTAAGFFDGPFGQKIYPQPWLLDLEIDENGFMIANFADRTGHQLGNSNGLAQSGPVEGVSAGDMLRLAPSGYPVNTATWTLENNASVGVGIPGGGTAGAGQLNGEGPGQGEFYSGDFYAPFHNEILLGGTALVYGSGEVATSAFDPTNAIRSGGLIVSSNSLGSKNRGVEIFAQDSPGTFGKAAGIGDIELICASAPVEIGNYVWFDANQNGVQDPNEQPLPGIIVRLFDSTGTTQIGTATTDANGRYIFSSSPVVANAGAAYAYNLPITTNTTYQVQIDMTQPNLAGYSTTTPNVGGVPGDVHDSDGLFNAVSNLDVATVTTGTPGQNDHTYDFGFFTPPYSLGNRIWFDNGAGGGTNDDGIQNGTEVGIGGVTVNLLDNGGNVIATTTTSATGYYIFDNLLPGTYSVQIPVSNFAAGGPLNGLTSSSPVSASPDNDVDLDDNGIGTIPNPATGITSGPVSLGLGNVPEPIGEPNGGLTSVATDNHSNLTVDFGFNGVSTNYSLGNRVWLDSNNSGVIDTNEIGIGNVALNLYVVGGGAGCTVSPTPLRTTSTTAAGYYLFDNLPACDYVVEVAPASCSAGGPLAGLANSTGAGQEANPNADGDSNDNGLDSTGTCSVRSGTVTLGTGPSEPTGETDIGPQVNGIAANDHSNLTVDFGYFGTPSNPQTPAAPVTLDPAITKQVDPAFAQPGDEVRWIITLTNPNAVAINNVSFVDNIPGQLQVISASVDAAGGSLVVNGNTVTYSIVVLNPGQTLHVTILTRVRAGTPVPFMISNTATLTGAGSGASASATLLSVGSLPATGFEPPWRAPLLIGIAVLLVLFTVGAVRLGQRGYSRQ